MTRRSLFLFLLVLSGVARADNVIVPALGPKAELVLTNLEPNETRLLVTFHGRDRVFETVTVAGHSMTVVDDLPAAPGLIRVSGASRFTARYGDVPAVPVDALAKEQVVRGGRVVIANPWKISASVTLTLLDADGKQTGQLYRLVPALDLLQLDLSAATVRVTAQVSVHASDGVSAPEVRVSSDIIAPPCAEPAFLGTPRPGRDEWLVVRPEGVSLDKLTPQRIAALRCDPSVELLEQP
jgi:hypothetical protein